MPQINLLRNTKVFFTTLTKDNVSTAAISPANTWELQVLGDFSYSQGTEQETITLNEAGSTPTRGQRSFNTAINPVDWSFGTYVRPYAVVAATTTASAATATGSVAVFTDNAHPFSVGDRITVSGYTPAGYNGTFYIESTTTNSYTVTLGSAPGGVATVFGTTVRAARTTAPEALLWNALAGASALYASSTWTEGSTTAVASFANSNAHQLARFALIFKVDNSIYFVENCAVNQADVSFGIDEIASISWSGQGTELIRLSDTGYVSALQAIQAANTWKTTAAFITNKLSTVTLTGYNIYTDGVTATATQAYTLALTGGQISISNNIQYLTPEVLGVVNKPIGYYTGTRAISGNITAYLKVAAAGDGGTKYASELLEELTAHSTLAPDNTFKAELKLGAAGGSFPFVNFSMPAAMLQIPNVEVQDVVSTTINFTAQASTGTGDATAFDINETNELTVEYVTA